MNSRRITTTYLAGLADQLSDRDRQMIDSLWRVRVATARQLQRLVYFEGTPRANARAAQRAVRRLVSWRVLARLDRSPGGRGGGSQGHVYCLDVAGQRLAEEITYRPVRRPWLVSRLFLRHALEVSQWYVELTDAERVGLIELNDFTGEPKSWRRYMADYSNAQLLKPDAFVRLTREGWEEYWFLEIDLATEHAPALRRQLDRYLSYWRSGAEQARTGGLFPKVLWIVPDERRHDELVTTFGRLPAETWALFLVATKEAAYNILTKGEPP